MVDIHTITHIRHTIHCPLSTNCIIFATQINTEIATDFTPINGKKVALSGVRQTSKFTLWRKSENKSLRLSLLSTYQFFKVLRKNTILSLLCSWTFHPITVRYSVVRPLSELFKQKKLLNWPYFSDTFYSRLTLRYSTRLFSSTFISLSTCSSQQHIIAF